MYIATIDNYPQLLIIYSPIIGNCRYFTITTVDLGQQSGSEKLGRVTVKELRLGHHYMPIEKKNNRENDVSLAQRGIYGSTP